jgi:hypothetical protein
MLKPAPNQSQSYCYDNDFEIQDQIQNRIIPSLHKFSLNQDTQIKSNFNIGPSTLLPMASIAHFRAAVKISFQLDLIWDQHTTL